MFARVTALMEVDRKDKEEETPEDREEAKAFFAYVDDVLKRKAQEEKELEEEQKRLGNVFTLPGKIRRGDKSQFTAFHDPVIEAASSEVRRYAVMERKDLTLEMKVRWGQANALVEQASFWSMRKECRDLVKELDLDPFVDEHEDALYGDKKHQYAPNGRLRHEAVNIWNEGRVIVYIQDMEDENTCWGSYKDGQPNGFLITHVKRRQLPIPK